MSYLSLDRRFIDERGIKLKAVHGLNFWIPEGVVMNQAMFGFLGGLNDLLPLSRRYRPIFLLFKENPSVKHLIESLGIPHTEIAQILVDGLLVNFNYAVQNNDRIWVYPEKVAMDGSPGLDWRDPQDHRLYFLLDNHLGKLAVYLRLLGFDTLYRNDYQDEELAEIAAGDDRILLTRDRRLLMRRQIPRGYCIRSLDPHRQLIEVMNRYCLQGHLVPFCRCLRCNGILGPVSKQVVLHRLEPLTRLYYDEFYQCQQCGQVFWKGSHYEHMRAFLKGLNVRLMQNFD